MKPPRLGLARLGLLVSGGGAFVGGRYYLTPQARESVTGCPSPSFLLT